MNTIEDLCALIEQNLKSTNGLDSEHLSPDTPLLLSGLLDSLTILRIVAQIEQRTGLTFPETSVVAANFRTPSALWSAIAELRTSEART